MYTLDYTAEEVASSLGITVQQATQLLGSPQLKTAILATMKEVAKQLWPPVIIDNVIHQPPNYDGFTPLGATYMDPMYGTTVKRISNAMTQSNTADSGVLTWIANEYSTASPFNKDNSRLILVRQSYFGLYSGDGRYLGDLPFEISASTEPRWSKKNVNSLYYHVGNKLQMYDVTLRTIY